ncbi:hypothetical protein [Methanocella sp. MCL-LM]|uniref:hypothetical protein n=1 Tax=Methanocella sp. MCL-LM TaxID=3412035 RepID=UPI003C757F9F
MKSASAGITGRNLTALSDRLARRLPGSLRYAFGQVHVVVAENSGESASSGLMTVLLLDLAMPGQCVVDIITGGCGRAPSDATTDPESDTIRHVIDLLQDICTAEGWKFSEGEPPELDEDLIGCDD